MFLDLKVTCKRPLLHKGTRTGRNRMNFTIGKVKTFRLNSVAARCSGDASVKSGKGNFKADL